MKCAGVSPKQSALHKEIFTCKAGGTAHSEVITFTETSAAFFCSTRSKGFAKPTGDLQIAIVHFQISTFIRALKSKLSQ